MRAICNVCKDKDTCSYIKNNKTSDCIDVQTADYGYEEAVDKACDVYKKELREILDTFDKIGKMLGIDELGEFISFEGCVKDFRKAMEE